MVGDASPHPDSNGCNFFVVDGAIGGAPLDPYSNPSGSLDARDAEFGKRGDDPTGEIADKCPHIASARFEVQHDVGNALARAVVGVLAAAAGRKDRKPVGIYQVGVVSAGAGGVYGGMFKQPNLLIRLSIRDGCNSPFHSRYRIQIRDGLGRNAPVDLSDLGETRVWDHVSILYPSSGYLIQRFALALRRRLCYSLSLSNGGAAMPASFAAVMAELVDALP